MASTSVVSQPTKSVWNGNAEPMKASYGKLMMWFFLMSDTFTFSALLITYGLERFSALSTDSVLQKIESATGNKFDVLGSSLGEIQEYVYQNLGLYADQIWPIPDKVFNAVPFLHGVDLPLVFVGIMTFILIMSSVTMVLAVEAGHRMDRNDVMKWMLWTIAGGIAFLSCQAFEWTHFIHGTDEVARLSNGEMMTGANLAHNQYGPPLFASLFFFITGFHGTHVFSGVVLNFLIFYNASTGVYEQRGHYEMVEKVGLYWHFVDLVWVFVFTFFYLI